MNSLTMLFHRLVALATSTADFTILRLWETTLSVVKKLFDYMGTIKKIQKKYCLLAKDPVFLQRFFFSIRVLHESDSNHRINKK